MKISQVKYLRTEPGGWQLLDQISYYYGYGCFVALHKNVIWHVAMLLLVSLLLLPMLVISYRHDIYSECSFVHS